MTWILGENSQVFPCPMVFLLQKTAEKFSEKTAPQITLS